LRFEDSLGKKKLGPISENKPDQMWWYIPIIPAMWVTIGRRVVI
jgi:hypothetical protein